MDQKDIYHLHDIGRKRKKWDLGWGWLKGTLAVTVIFNYLKAILQPGINSDILFCSYNT